MKNSNSIDFKEKIWEHVEKEILAAVQKFPDDFKYEKQGKTIFYQYFEKYSSDIKNNVMFAEVNELDSHKVAAVIICSVIQANALRTLAYESEVNGKIFVGNEKVAVKIGLSYMTTALKKIIEGTAEEEKFTEYIMPKALMCDTDYITIICRNLYYAKTYYKLNPIDLANTLFLLEQFTLLQKGVNFEVLRQAVRDKCH